MHVTLKCHLALQQRFSTQALPRKPEMDLVMLDREENTEYDRSGRDGSLAILYDLVVNTLLKVSPLSGEALDICCGASQLLCKTAKTMPDMHFTGLDLSPRMLQFGKENSALYGTGNVDFTFGSMYELESLFPDKRFDLITWSLAMHHCETDEQVVSVLNAAGRLLKHNGCLLVFDFIRPKTGKIALHLTDLYAGEESNWLFQDNLDSYKASFTFAETEHILQKSELKGYRHIRPVLANIVQFIIISPLRRKAKRVNTLPHLWQKIDASILRAMLADKL